MFKSEFSLLFDDTIPMYTRVQVLNCSPEFLAFLQKEGFFRASNNVRIFRNKAFQGRFLKMAYGKVYLTGFQEHNAHLFEPVTVSFIDSKEAQLFRQQILDAMVEYADYYRSLNREEGSTGTSSPCISWTLNST